MGSKSAADLATELELLLHNAGPGQIEVPTGLADQLVIVLRALSEPDMYAADDCPGVHTSYDDLINSLTGELLDLPEGHSFLTNVYAMRRVKWGPAKVTNEDGQFALTLLTPLEHAEEVRKRDGQAEEAWEFRKPGEIIDVEEADTPFGIEIDKEIRHPHPRMSGPAVTPIERAVDTTLKGLADIDHIQERPVRTTIEFDD